MKIKDIGAVPFTELMKMLAYAEGKAASRGIDRNGMQWMQIVFALEKEINSRFEMIEDGPIERPRAPLKIPEY